ncbi:hypothetical protein FBZ84_12663 [Azospirillum baldaniorum]|uniref:hypothetical protein n=1 Tax=Azospirillum baldaniorum TaxID=1064539 RepID=UPI0011A7B95A|nr:hypothetical protein [Azospirillum baldaniorum]TWA55424.1 hypothetical protein FBZ84_12663 [Azospirillum baldaniorum]
MRSNFEHTHGRTVLSQMMNVARVYGDRDPSELDGIGLSILYELAAPSTPPETRAQIEAGIQNGAQPTVISMCYMRVAKLVPKFGGPQLSAVRVIIPHMSNVF